jgi:nitrate reductase gamma subunit
MTAVVYATIYAGALAFLIGCVARAVQYARLPAHLRWELYPVPHEAPERVAHGGSRYEETDWWKRPVGFNLLGELKFMVPEMLFMKGLWEFNRKLWYRSFPFHFGLYLVIGSVSLLLLSVIAVAVAGPQLLWGTTGAVVRLLYAAAWLIGAPLAILGALGLLARRLRDPALRLYTTPADIFNLLLFIVTLGLLFAGYLLARGPKLRASAIAHGLLTFDTSLEIPGVPAAGLVLGALVAAYIPLTHMSHFIAKYFTYHAVRWDDRAVAAGGALGKKIAEYLTYRPAWSAAHVGADGVKTWAEVATANPAEWIKK